MEDGSVEHVLSSAGTIEGERQAGASRHEDGTDIAQTVVGRKAVIKTGSSRDAVYLPALTALITAIRRAGTRDFSRHSRRSEQLVFISVADLFVSRRAASRSGLDFASVGQASDSGSGLTWRTNRPVDSSDHTCWDHSVCHHVSLMVGNIEQPGLRFRSAKSKESRSIQMWPTH